MNPKGECNWCRIGVPINEVGNHIIKHYYGSGDGAIPCPNGQTEKPHASDCAHWVNETCDCVTGKDAR